MLAFRTIVLWIHLAGIIVWIGGMIAIPFVVTPALRRLANGRSDELIVALVRRFQRLSRELIFVILLTGIFNVINTGVLTGFAYGDRYLTLIGIKLLLFLGMAANQAWYSFSLVPRGDRRRASWSAVANVVMAAAVLYLGVSLRFG